MVERVARAIWEEWWTPPPKLSWDEAADGNKRVGRLIARAAIAAMREPTDAMKEAGLKVIMASWDYGGMDQDTEIDAWQVMIDAALEERT